MKEINVGYFKSFGVKEINQARDAFLNEHPDIKVNLIPLYQDQMEDALDEGKIDLAFTDKRDNDFESYQVIPLAEIGIVVLLQAGNFMLGQQTIELDELKAIPNMLIAKTDEEAGELHYHKDILGIKSPFIAVDSFNEAALMATSGSGYFLMNENTADLLGNDQLQKMFVLKNGKQLRQEYIAVTKKRVDKEIMDFIDQLKTTLN
ncbi:LysR family transcriptional regulator substrate-binding protein [Lactobacillus hamsteri]|nr:LysR family transcriptional regulator substrate-binding protein [Lactobacillus hamsteri]